MASTATNKYRAAIEVLHRGRDLLVDSLADEVVDQADDLLEGGFLLNEFLEGQGTRLHFLCLLVAQLEQSAEQHEQEEAPPPAPKGRRRSRSKKLSQQASPEGSADET